MDLEWYDPMQGTYAHMIFGLLASSIVWSHSNDMIATTSGGSLRLRIDEVTDASDNHNLTYRSGMVRRLSPSALFYNIQTTTTYRFNHGMSCGIRPFDIGLTLFLMPRNKFCFTGGILEGKTELARAVMSAI